MRLSGRLAVLLDAALRPLHLWPVALPPAGQRRAFFNAGKKLKRIRANLLTNKNCAKARSCSADNWFTGHAPMGRERFAVFNEGSVCGPTFGTL